jgi:hypothetical protein
MCTLFSLKMCHTCLSLKICSTYLCPASSHRIVTWYLIINMYVVSHTSKNLHNNSFYLHQPISLFTNYWHKYVDFHSSINQYASLHIHKPTYDTPCQQLKHERWTHMASKEERKISFPRHHYLVANQIVIFFTCPLDNGNVYTRYALLMQIIPLLFPWVYALIMF